LITDCFSEYSKITFTASDKLKNVAYVLHDAANANGTLTVLANLTRTALGVALCNAVRASDGAAVDALVAAGANVCGEADAGLDRPLALATGVRCNDEDDVLDIMRRLVAHGAPVDDEGLDHDSPLAVALACDDLVDERVQLLLDAGADPLRRDSLGRTVLHYCAVNKQNEWLARFVGMGADVRTCVMARSARRTAKLAVGD
jgi:ankyrin repeat protein